MKTDFIVSFVASAAFAIFTISLSLMDYRAPIWPTVILTIILFGSINSARRHESAAKRRMFLLLPAFHHENWYAKLLCDLIAVLEQHGYDLVVKFPSNDYDPQTMIRLLHRIEASKRSYAGGFVVAASPKEIERELGEFCEALESPVVFLDVEPFSDVSAYPSRSAYVGYDAQAIGRTGAKIISLLLGPRHLTEPKILVVGGSIQQGRQLGFVARMKEIAPASKLVVPEEGKMERKRAQRVVEACCSEARRASDPFDAVFCTSDAMAMGALDALRRQPRAFGKSTFVVGVDGTDEARAIIESGSDPLVESIVQDTHQLASTAFNVFSELEDRKLTDRVRLLAPEEPYGVTQRPSTRKT